MYLLNIWTWPKSLLSCNPIYSTTVSCSVLYFDIVTRITDKFFNFTLSSLNTGGSTVYSTTATKETSQHRLKLALVHYCDVIMGTVTSQIISLTSVYSTVYSGADQRKHQRSASLAFVRGIHRWPVNSPHKGSVTRKMFPFDDVIMNYVKWPKIISITCDCKRNTWGFMKSIIIKAVANHKAALYARQCCFSSNTCVSSVKHRIGDKNSASHFLMYSSLCVNKYTPLYNSDRNFGAMSKGDI